MAGAEWAAADVIARISPTAAAEAAAPNLNTVLLVNVVLLWLSG
jgi:hypothetical protein